ncbi:AAA family ATPase, partial [Microcoleus sp. herbarium7]|uniref:AAA family ATPase n=1 Tax=Microcoleus sp. herbarium7 TaxID=3055435 RepID=UPI002FD1A79E
MTDAKAVLSTHFLVLTPEDPIQSSLYQIIAIQSERHIRCLIPRIQSQDPKGDVKVFQLETSIAAFLAFHGQPFAGLMMGSMPPEQWLKSRADKPLDLQEALAIASDILVAKKPQTQVNIELDVLMRRCNVSSFDWNKYIADLEAEIHAAVDGKKAQERHERVRLELSALLKETDPLKALDAKKFIAQRYGYKIAEIEQLLRYLDQSSKLPKTRSLSLEELFSMPQQGIDYVIPGMLPVGECALLVASPKAGKSLLAYDAAFAVATGEDTFLGETVKQGKVLIVQCDESIGSATGRLIKRGFRKDDTNVQFMDSFSIFQLVELEERLEAFRPDLVIIDSLRRISIGTGISENSAEFADSVYKIKELLFRYNAAGILIHHTNKNQDALGVERVRGSGAIAGAVWGVWELSHIPKPDPNNKKRQIIDPKDATRVLSITARDIEGYRLKIELDPENNRWVSLGEDGVEEGEKTNRKSNEAKILELLKAVAPKGLEASEINEHVGLDRGVYCYLNRLLGKGVIGSRPSSIDRRRTVYFFPLPGDNDTEIDRKIDRN